MMIVIIKKKLLKKKKKIKKKKKTSKNNKLVRKLMKLNFRKNVSIYNKTNNNNSRLICNKSKIIL